MIADAIIFSAGLLVYDEWVLKTWRGRQRSWMVKRGVAFFREEREQETGCHRLPRHAACFPTHEQYSEF